MPSEFNVRDNLNPKLVRFIDTYNEKLWERHKSKLGNLYDLPHYKLIWFARLEGKTNLQIARILCDTYFKGGQGLRRDSPWLRKHGVPMSPRAMYHFVSDLKRLFGLDPKTQLTYDEMEKVGFIALSIPYRYRYMKTQNKKQGQLKYTVEDLQELTRDRDGLKAQVNALKKDIDRMEEAREIEQMKLEERAYRDHQRYEANKKEEEAKS